jgi:hypothetical protein
VRAVRVQAQEGEEHQVRKSREREPA